MNYLRTKLLVHSDESSVFNSLNKYFKKSKDFWVSKDGKYKLRDITTSVISLRDQTELEIYYISSPNIHFQPEMTIGDVSFLERIFDKLK